MWQMVHHVTIRIKSVLYYSDLEKHRHYVNIHKSFVFNIRFDRHIEQGR